MRHNSLSGIGYYSFRGTRPTNEDRYTIKALSIGAGGGVNEIDAQRLYVGIFDGLSHNLHDLIENVTLADLPDTIATLKGFGGYFKRYRLPNVFKDIADRDTGKALESENNRSALTPEQRIQLSFLKADTLCAEEEEKSDPSSGKQPDQVGSTGSVAIVQTKDRKPFWDSQQYDILIGHVGDTRILLCDASNGEVVSLSTGDHHPGNSFENDRLRRYAGYVMTDSWGADRILGSLATSRAFGDTGLKRYGVSAEPDFVLITDGITSVMTDQEIIDFVKQYDEPQQAAKELVNISEQFGTEDNATCMVVRFKSWGSAMPDYTKRLREYKLSTSTMSSRQSW
ncbi:phosphatase 2C-like domain-containing protein [Umbelopsis sp. AD052]|nr:phosphatase 2C-like domain-containing protein [Umbelopsis sp. AD052]